MIRILIVDDSRVTREVTKVYLIRENINVVEARNGEEALKIARESKPDILIADLQMPRLDGPGLCLAISGDATLSSTPVIILTSNLDAFSRDRCLNAGAREVLTKPVQPSELIAAIDRQLGPISPFRKILTATGTTGPART